MEKLVTVPEEVETPGRESLREMRCEEEAGEEGEGCVSVVQGVRLVVSAALSGAQEYPVEQRNVVEHVGVCEGQCAKGFTQLWSFQFWKPGEAGESGANDGVKHCDRHVATVEGAVYPLIWDNVRRVGNGRT